MIRLYYTFLRGDCSHGAQHEAGRALLRAVLGEGPIEYEPGGRPYIKGAPDFSISHSGALVMIAIGDDGMAGRIGCDAERLDRVIRNPGAIRKKLAPTAEEEALPLLQLWVRREAIYKAGGSGKVFYPEPPEGYIVAVCCEAGGGACYKTVFI